MSEQMLNAAAIDQVKELAQQAQGHKITFERPVYEPDDVYYIVDSRTGLIGGKVIGEPKPRHISANSTADVVAFVAAGGTGGEIYYDGASVVGCYKDKVTGRVHTARMALPLQATFDAMLNIETKSYPQRQFWNLLRTVFRDSISSDAITIFKAIRWSDSGAAEQNLSVGKESLGKSYTGSVTGEGAIPEELTFSIGVFGIHEHRTLKFPVVCAVDTILEQKSFRLIPTDNQLAKAKEQALKELRDNIDRAVGKTKDIVVIYGTPK